jgi:RHS repeat-associated protein
MGRSASRDRVVAFLAFSVVLVSCMSWVPAGAANETASSVSAVAAPGPQPDYPIVEQRGGGPTSGSPEPVAVQTEPSSGEVRSLRTETSRTYVDSTGNRVAYISQGPINYKDEQGRWQRIDNSLIPKQGAGAGWENRANSFHATFPATLSDGPVQVDIGEEFISYGLKGGAAVGQASGDSVTYAEALRGVDLTYEVSNNAVKETLTLRSAASSDALIFDVHTTAGLTATKNKKGGVDFADATGKTVFAFEPPTMQDSADHPVDGPITMSLDSTGLFGTTVSLHANEAWLNDARRVWPIVIDPVITPNPTQDCTIASNSQSTSLCTDTTIKTGWDGTNKFRSLLQFSLSSIPTGEVIQNANLNLYMTSSTTANNSSWTVHRMFQPWDNNATWLKRNASTNWTSAGAEGDYGTGPWDTRFYSGGSVGWRQWYPTGLVQAWINGTYGNNGLMLRQGSEAVNNVFTFTSVNSTDSAHWPQLIVTYADKLGELKHYKMYSQQLSDRMDLNLNVVNGNMVLHNSDLYVKGIGHDLRLDRSYNSIYDSNNPAWNWGYGWSSTTTACLIFYGDGSATFWSDTGYKLPFVKNSDGTFAQPAGINADLVQNGDGTYTLTWHQSGEKYNFNSSGQITSDVDRNGNKITFSYTSGNLAGITDTEGRATTISYTTIAGTPRATQVTDSASRIYTYGYDTQGRLTSFTDPENGSTHPTTYTYDANWNIQQITDPRGVYVTLSYDTATATKVTSITYNCPSSICGTLKTSQWTVAYFSDHTEITDPNSHTTKYYFNGEQEVTTIRDANNHDRTMAYDTNQNVQTYTDQASNVFTTDYAAPAKGGPEENISTLQLAPSGTGPTVSIQYTTNAGDANQYFPLDVSGGGAAHMQYAYDCRNNLKTVTDDLPAGQNQFNYTYDVGAPCNQTNPPRGTLSSMQDARGNSTSLTYTYNPNGTLASAQLAAPSPLGSVTYNYDSLSRVSSTVDGKSQTTSFVYDNRDRVKTITYQGGVTITYTYDGDGNVTQRVDNMGTATFQYKDPNNRMTQKIAGDGTTFNYTYDGTGNLTQEQVVDPGTNSRCPSGTPCNTAYHYEATDLVDQITQPGISTPIKFTYDTNGLRTQIDLPNGTNVWTVHMYAAYSGTRICNIVWSTAAKPAPFNCTTQVASAIRQFRYTYTNGGTDSALRYTTMDKDNNTTTFTYDALKRLQQAQTKNSGGTVTDDRTYTYDPVGNMTKFVANASTTSYGFNAANEMCWSVAGSSTNACASPPAGSTTYNYDGNGNQISSSGGIAFTYNSKNQATAIMNGTAASYAGSSQDEQVTLGSHAFAYSELGLDVERVSGSTPFYYTRDDGGLIMSQQSATARNYYLTDGQGSVVSLIAPSGTVLNSYTYDPYGNATTETGTNYNPWQYAQGFDMDAFSGGPDAYHFGARFYDEHRSRWTQQDSSIGQLESPMSLNRYAYVDDEPVGRTDPSGRCGPACIEWLFIVLDVTHLVDTFLTVFEQTSGTPGSDQPGRYQVCIYGLNRTAGFNVDC